MEGGNDRRKWEEYVGGGSDRRMVLERIEGGMIITAWGFDIFTVEGGSFFPPIWGSGHTWG